MDPQHAIEVAKSTQGMSPMQIAVLVLLIMGNISPHLQTIRRWKQGKNGTSTAAGATDKLALVVAEIEKTVNTMAKNVHDLKRDMAEVRTDVGALKTDVAELKTEAAVGVNEFRNLNGRIKRVEERCDLRHGGH